MENEPSSELDLRRRRNKGRVGRLVFLFLVLAAIFLGSFAFGRYAGISLVDIVKILLSPLVPFEKTWPPDFDKVVVLIRLPRILAAVLIGSALALSGATYQAVFKNPLVSPDILGASAGASLGAALAIFNGLGPAAVQASAFAVAIGAVALAWAVSRRVRRDPVLGLILAGVFVSSFASALVSLVKFLADPNDKLPSITYWLLGSLANIPLSQVLAALAPMALAATPLLMLRWRLNLLSFGEDEARALGIETKWIRLGSVVCATVLTALAIALGGLIGWVGLVIPHLVRRFMGVDNRAVLPASLLAGGAFLLVVDDVARNLVASEIPIGVLTALVGAPFFVALLMRRESNAS